MNWQRRRELALELDNIRNTLTDLLPHAEEAPPAVWDLLLDIRWQLGRASYLLDPNRKGVEWDRLDLGAARIERFELDYDKGWVAVPKDDR